MLTSVYLVGTNSIFAQDKPQAVAAESPSNAPEPSLAEKIRDISPDKKFAMRVSYDAKKNQELIGAETADAKTIFPQAIKAIELVSLPDKSVVTDLVPSDYIGDNYGISLSWSQDSDWFAYRFADGSRVASAFVWHRSDDNFAQLDSEDLRIDVKGDFWTHYVRPIKWTKPGVLLLEQWSGFHRRSGGLAISFTAKFDERTGKFRIISKKKVPWKE